MLLCGVFYFISAIVPPKEVRPGLIRKSRVISDTARGECPPLRFKYLTFLKLLHCNRYVVFLQDVMNGTSSSERFVPFRLCGVAVYKVTFCYFGYLMAFALEVAIA